MADARITSGNGDGLVKTYTRDTEGKILVRGVKAGGVQVTIRIEEPDRGSDPGESSGTNIWKGSIAVQPGRHTLVIETTGGRGKELRQQINVV